MIFLKVFCYIFFAYGLTEIMVYGRGPFGICEHIRKLASRISDGFGQLFQCPLCFSTWVGLVSSVINVTCLKSLPLTPFTILTAGLGSFWVGVLTVVLDMFFTAGIVWFITRIEEWLEKPQVEYEADEYE